MDRRGIHQVTPTCKTNTKTTVVIRRPSDGKVSFFLEDLEFGATIISIRIFIPFLWCDLLLFYGGRKEDPSLLDSGRFLPIMLGEGGSYFGKGDLFFPSHNYLPDRTAAKRTFLFCQRRRCEFMDELMLVKWRAGWQLRWEELRIGKISA